jgi:hypothetical protein
VQQQVGHTDPILTWRIYQQLLKRKRREECRARGFLRRLGQPGQRHRRGPKQVVAAIGPKSEPDAVLEPELL